MSDEDAIEREVVCWAAVEDGIRMGLLSTSDEKEKITRPS